MSVLLIVLASLTFLLDPLILKWLIDMSFQERRKVVDGGCA